MPRLVRLYIQQVAIGFGLSAIFTTILIYFNVANLQRLVFGSSDGLLGLFLIFFFNGLVFAGAQFAIRIMRMGHEDEDDDDHHGGSGVRHSDPAPQPLPVRISVKS
ncbi:hypothetical protein PUT78_16185 [Roseinatronobacter sp. HJB301]|uniref:Uncharacterized protein n=2 Tax=Roseinatronobacter alkalisoli TaxID=3028235 RepID=A0ABT5TBZ3_9RHOB|nr:hypothetical protein [Roseinatronobacter sp. HJB301]MDD7972638.1 hypothetical protein [Roseinatronobacter sp. HJB301]